MVGGLDNNTQNNTSSVEQSTQIGALGSDVNTGSRVEHVEVNVPTQASSEAVAAASSESVRLPYQVVSRADVSKSLRELQLIDDYFHQAAIRGSKDQSIPALGKALDSISKANGLNLLRVEDRNLLKQFLSRLKANSPVIHISFPSEASATFLIKIIEWFRTEVHPHALLNVGLQPDLVAGCIVRTTNKVYDFSFRKKFDKSKEKLLNSISVDMATENKEKDIGTAQDGSSERVSTPNLHRETLEIENEQSGLINNENNSVQSQQVQSVEGQL